jgi:hypothetical protein
MFLALFLQDFENMTQCPHRGNLQLNGKRKDVDSGCCEQDPNSSVTCPEKAVNRNAKGVPMPQKLTNKEQKQRVMKTEKEAADHNRAGDSLKSKRGKSQDLMDELARPEIELLIEQLMLF